MNIVGSGRPYVGCSPTGGEIVQTKWDALINRGLSRFMENFTHMIDTVVYFKRGAVYEAC